MLKLNVDSENIDLNRISKDFNSFIVQYLIDKVGEEMEKSLIGKIDFKPKLFSPLKNDWKDLADVNTHGDKEFIESIGTYTINPDTIHLDFSNISPERIKIEALPKYYKGKIWEVAKLIIEQYGNDYYIPGIEYLKFLKENNENWLKLYVKQQRDMALSGKPDFSKSFSNYFFFGSVICRPMYFGQDLATGYEKASIGSWLVPAFTLGASMNNLSTAWLSEYNYIVLIKK